MRVEDAQGAPPTIPFWIGEAPGRTDELSFAVSRLRTEISERFDADATAAHAWLRDDIGLSDSAAQQIANYLGGAKAAFGILPTQSELAMERFFDEAGGTQLVIHTPFGSRINRAWGLALRKRFCRSFNFELQAAATEDAIILSLSTSHSFPLEDVTRFLHSNSVRHVLIQALLDAPMFGVRWRWNAVTSLALPRFAGGSKVPPQLQRMKSEDLLAAVFPDQVACLENIVGERQIPDHPLVAQTLHDCLHEAMDIEGLEALLRRIESGEVRFVCRDLTAPSPLAAEVLSARPYAFLDDAPLEERRTQAVMSRRWGDIESTEDFGRLDPDAIAAVREESWPQARTADELHEALMGLGFLTNAELRANAAWPVLCEELIAQRRATRMHLPLPQTPFGGEGWGEGVAPQTSETSHQSDRSPLTLPSPPSLAMGERELLVAAERLPQLLAIFPDASIDPPIIAPVEFTEHEWIREEALADIIRARLTGLGPVQAAQHARTLQLPPSDIDVALLTLEREGTVMQGHFTPDTSEIEWCDRHLLARIHRYTVQRLRREIEPVEPRDFMRFLIDWHKVAPGARGEGPDALAAVLAQLEGFEAPTVAWEAEILPARIAGYEISWLDDLCTAGRIVWSRLRPRAASSSDHGSGPVRATPIVLIQRRKLALWNSLGASVDDSTVALSSRTQTVADFLRAHGASFFDELLAGTKLLHVELEEALAELVAAGQINADSFAGLRALLVPQSRRPSPSRRRGRRTALLGIADAGRWSLLRRAAADASANRPETIEHIARTLLRRYGVVCCRLLAREADWLPPWRELLRVYQRMEARGEVRGGRFIAGLSGEQFALPEAIAPLRAVRQRPRDGALIAMSAADPLNLVGSIIAGTNVPALTGSRILYRDGIPVATLVSGAFNALEPMDAVAEWKAKSFLLRSSEHEPASKQLVD